MHGVGRRGQAAPDDDGVLPRQRFTAAVAADPTDGCAAGDEAVARALREAPVAGVGRIVYSSNAAFLLELEAPDPDAADRPLRAVYKPARGERPLWDFPHQTLHFREVATYLVDAALGLGLVPATVLRDGPYGPGSVQRFVHVRDERLGRAARDELEERLRDLAVLDVLVNNADRKSAHLLVTEDGRLQGIDHGLTFLPYPRQRTVLLELGGSSLPDGTASRLAALAGDGARRRALLERLERLLAPAETSAFAGRLDELAADPWYPVLDAWDGRPFEWW